MALTKYNPLFIYNSRSLRNRLRVNSGSDFAEIFSVFKSVDLDVDNKWIEHLRSYASSHDPKIHKSLIILSGGDGSLQALINVIENENLFSGCRPDLLLLASGSTNFFSLRSLDYPYNSLDDLKLLVSSLSKDLFKAKFSNEYMMRCERSSSKADIYGFNVTGLSVVNLSESYLSYKRLSGTSKKPVSNNIDGEKKEANRFRRVLFFYSLAMIFRFAICRKIYEKLHSPRTGKFLKSLLKRYLSAKMREDVEKFKDVKLDLSYNGKHGNMLHSSMSIYAFWLSAFSVIRINRYLSFHFNHEDNHEDVSDKTAVYFCCSHGRNGLFGLFKILRFLVSRSGFPRKSPVTSIKTSHLSVKGLEKILFDGEGYSISKDETLTFSKPFSYRFVTAII